MNQYVFAARNVADKLIKIAGSPGMFKFYWRTYILSRFDTVDPDVYIVSYPKCGRTWLRVLLQRYLKALGVSSRHHNDGFLSNIPGRQTIKFEHDQSNWVPAPLRVNQLSFDTTKYSGKKVVFLVRDPRDVLVSSWYHLKYRERIYQGALSAFIRDDLVGIHKVLAFMNMWLENSHVPDDFFLLTYEELYNETTSSFREVLEWIGIDVEPEALQMAVEESSFEKMKHMESKGTLKEPWMKPGSENSEKSMKIRKGKVGSFREELSDGDTGFLNAVIRSELSGKLPYHQPTRGIE